MLIIQIGGMICFIDLIDPSHLGKELVNLYRQRSPHTINTIFTFVNKWFIPYLKLW